MKTIEITGKNYFGKWNKTRTACRCIIVEGSKILLSYENETNQWIIPGGGLEDSESEKACCIREVAEEPGKLVEVSDCVLEIDEYYEDWKWVSKYFVGKIAGNTEIKLTQREREVGMVPRWIDTDEMRRGLYLREYTALTELI